MEARFIVDEKGNKKDVILSIEDFRSLIEELETQEDIKAAKEVLNDKNQKFHRWEDVKSTLMK